MKRFFNTIYLFFGLVFFLYLILPTPEYPTPPTDALQSDEPGDTEDPLRRAYFTNYSRDEVQEHYRIQFSKNFPKILTLKLIYPPEEAFVIIRDQTRSTHLVEFTHPIRDSFYINEFVAKEKKDTILINDQIWAQKITVKYIESSLIDRMLIYFLTMLVIYVVTRQLIDFVKRLINLLI